MKLLCKYTNQLGEYYNESLMNVKMTIGPEGEEV